MYPRHCSICKDVICNGPSQWDQHILGDKHLKATALLALSTKLESITVKHASSGSKVAGGVYTTEAMYPRRCDACRDVMCNGPSQWDQHVSGAKHLKAAALLDLSKKLASVSLKPSSPDGKAADGASTAEVSSPSPPSVFPSDPLVFRCTYCPDLCFSGRVPYEAHLLAKKHLANVARSAAANPSSLVGLSPERFRDTVVTVASNGAHLPSAARKDNCGFLEGNDSEVIIFRKHEPVKLF